MVVVVVVLVVAAVVVVVVAVRFCEVGPRLASTPRTTRPLCVCFVPAAVPAQVEQRLERLQAGFDGMFHHFALPEGSDVTAAEHAQRLKALVAAVQACPPEYYPPG